MQEKNSSRLPDSAFQTKLIGVLFLVVVFLSVRMYRHDRDLDDLNRQIDEERTAIAHLQNVVSCQLTAVNTAPTAPLPHAGIPTPASPAPRTLDTPLTFVIEGNHRLEVIPLAGTEHATCTVNHGPAYGSCTIRPTLTPGPILNLPSFQYTILIDGHPLSIRSGERCFKASEFANTVIRVYLASNNQLVDKVSFPEVNGNSCTYDTTERLLTSPDPGHTLTEQLNELREHERDIAVSAAIRATP